MSFSPSHSTVPPYQHSPYPPPSSYYANTPPPPPPKSHHHSQIGTPQPGPPVPAPPSSHPLQPLSPQPQQMPTTTNPPAQSQEPLEPEEGWLPAQLKEKPKSDLHQILTTPTLLHALSTAPSTTHSSLPTSQTPLKILLSQNISLATSLKTLESTLTSQRQQTQSHLLHLHSLEHQWRTTQTRMDEALSPFSPKALYQRLNQSIAEQEQLNAALEESFLDDGEGGEVGEREVGEFLKRFREGKKVERLRRERKARWDEGRVGGWR